MSFARIFKKFRLRSEFSTLAEFGNALSDEGYILEDSTFSHWQQGKRIPTDRILLLTVIKVFLKKNGIISLQEANMFMESANNGYLTHAETEMLFGATLEDLSFPREVSIEPKTSEANYDSTLLSLKESKDVLVHLEEQINLCHEKIYEGYPGIAYKNLYKLAKLIIGLKLEKKQSGMNLLSKINWIRVRCLSDLTKENDFRAAFSESNRMCFLAKDQHTSELGPSYWMRSAIQRLELITRRTSAVSTKELDECVAIANLALYHTPKQRVDERFVEHLELAKIALLIKDETLFDREIDRAFNCISSLSPEFSYLEVMAWDVQARGYLRFNHDIGAALKNIRIGKRLCPKRYQAISLFLHNTELQTLRSSKDQTLISYARRLQSKLAIEVSLLENPYQTMRLKKKQFIGL